MSSGSKCGDCGVPIPTDSPDGFCIECLLRLGLRADKTNPSTDAAGRASEEVPAENRQPTQPLADRSEGGARLGAGTVVGKYRLIEQIGEGGCGVVYRAQREEPVRQRVAFKIIKLGMDTRDVVARFEAERQVLALLDHPNIARVLDAGATETGRPYFVMELVSGTRITEFCRRNGLSLRQRLELFIQVCRAIQHAHQKGIIHRDIKPSNILVGFQDGVPVLKVIDFGIAKATQGRLLEQTVVTALAQFLGTPAYMSPEQAGLGSMGGLDIDTRSDLYSLGVLLYELLTGKTPFDLRELAAAGFEGLRRTILHEEPPAPSTRLARELAEVRRTRQGQSRSVPSAKTAVPAPRPVAFSGTSVPGTDSPEQQIRSLIQTVRGDLDWIVMKCLEKDRARRYETASALATDIERHLSHEPVTAGPPGRLYRWKKLVRRNRIAVAFAGVVALVLLLGIAVSSWEATQARRAERAQARLRQNAEAAQRREADERRKAVAAAAKSQQIADFLKELLDGVGPSTARGRDTTMLREILDKTAGRIGNALINQPDVEMELRSILAETYDELGSYPEMERMSREMLRLARSWRGEQNASVAHALRMLAKARARLGDFAEAETLARQSLELWRKLPGTNGHEVATTLLELGGVLESRSNFLEAEDREREALALFRQQSTNDSYELGAAYCNLARTLHQEGKTAEAEPLARQGLKMLQRVLGDEHPEVSTAMNNLALILFAKGDLPGAEQLHRDVLVHERKLLGNEHPHVARSLHNLAIALLKQGKLSEAEACVREALQIIRKALGPQHYEVAYSMGALANILVLQERHAEAESLQREVLAMRRQTLGEESQETARALNNLGSTLGAQGKFEEAESVERQALALARQLLGEQHPSVAEILGNLGSDLEGQRKFEEAASRYSDKLAIERKLPGDHRLTICLTAGHLASILVQLGRFTNAEMLARESLTLLQRKLPIDWHTFNVQRTLGASLLGQGRFIEAEPELLAAYRGLARQLSRIPVDRRFRLKDALVALVRLYDTIGPPEMAADWKQKLESFEKENPGPLRPTPLAPNPP